MAEHASLNPERLVRLINSTGQDALLDAMIKKLPPTAEQATIQLKHANLVQPLYAATQAATQQDKASHLSSILERLGTAAGASFIGTTTTKARMAEGSSDTGLWKRQAWPPCSASTTAPSVTCPSTPKIWWNLREHKYVCHEPA
ncbi:MAG: hypothetical protein Q7V20_02770 [Aquabacterium sp.]|nr:hypothetical protein [Aquabacterium sp.]MDO9002361.1 hypothetical protein [Aquabacterium sp.]